MGQPVAPTLPALSLRNLAGETVTLDQSAGQPTVIHLWSKDCGRCPSELDLLQSAARSARYGGFRYLFINQSDSSAEVADYARRHGLPREHVFLDPTLELTDALDTYSFPASYFFRADGKLEEARGTVLRPDFSAFTLDRLIKP